MPARSDWFFTPSPFCFAGQYKDGWLAMGVEAIIDTDNWPVIVRASWREYLEIRVELGVPPLYALTHIDSTQEPLEAEDYELIRQV